jgi:hypothetical protein
MSDQSNFMVEKWAIPPDAIVHSFSLETAVIDHVNTSGQNPQFHSHLR